MSILSIKQGELRGYHKKSESGKLYYGFKGIPYAKPPIGDLRFKAPLIPDKWIGIRDATKHGSISPQWDIITGRLIEGNEDCLFLNVYTPDIKGDIFPVMVHFHGGDFQSGSGNSYIYEPDCLVDEDVVLVTVNFRLEALGLLCLETKEVPGNAAMKDQVMALKWVKENISSFGGDPGNVTISGENSGGVAATYHMISPMSKGLFHKVIAHNACIFNYWGITHDNVDRAFRLGKYLGIDTDDINELLMKLRNIPASSLRRVNCEVLTESEKKSGVPIYFCPVVEKTYQDQESFLPKSPMELISENNFEHVPILTGYNSTEGIQFLNHTIEELNLINADFTRKLPRDIFRSNPPEILKELAEEMRIFYFGSNDKEITSKDIEQIIKMDSDINFVIGIQKFAKIMAKTSNSPVYLYRISFDGELNHTKRNSLKNDSIEGAWHGDDLFYLLETWMSVYDGLSSSKTIKRMAKMWTNFAKYGNPTPMTDELIPIKWNAITSDEINFLDIGNELRTGTDPDKDRMNFWKEIYNRLSSDDIVKFP